MDNKEIVRYFTEAVVSNRLIGEMPVCVSRRCTARSGEALLPSGIEGMRQRLCAVRKPCPHAK